MHGISSERSFARQTHDISENGQISGMKVRSAGKKIHGHEISPYRGGSFRFHVYLVSVSANARLGVAHRRRCGEAARPAAQTSGMPNFRSIVLFKQIIALDSQVYSGR